MRERKEYLLPNGHEIRHAFPGRRETSNVEIAENEFGALNSFEIGRQIFRPVADYRIGRKDKNAGTTGDTCRRTGMKFGTRFRGESGRRIRKSLKTNSAS